MAKRGGGFGGGMIPGNMQNMLKQAQRNVSGIQFTIEGDGNTHFVKADPKRFSQVVSYAIANADYYKMKGKVAVKFWGNQDEVVVQVDLIKQFLSQ